VTPNPSPGDSGPAWPTRSTDFGEGDRVSVSWPIRSRTRQVADLFQPVASSPPPAATLTDQPITSLNSLNQEDELLSALAPRSESAPVVQRWVSRGAGLIVGTPGAVIGLVGSAALVLVMAGMTMVTTSSPAESPRAENAPRGLPVPAAPAIGDAPVTVSPIDTPAGFAGPAPVTAASAKPAAVSVAQQPVPTTQRGETAAAATPPAPDHASPVPPPAPPTSTVTSEDTQYWTYTPGYSMENMGSSPAATRSCNCDASMRMMPHRGYRSPRADRQGEPQAVQRGEYGSTSTTQEVRTSEQGKQARQAAHPGPKAAPRPSPNRGS
jgi:hypothetical protein